jgi:hypothetical protein
MGTTFSVKVSLYYRASTPLGGRACVFWGSREGNVYVALTSESFGADGVVGLIEFSLKSQGEVSEAFKIVTVCHPPTPLTGWSLLAPFREVTNCGEGPGVKRTGMTPLSFCVYPPWAEMYLGRSTLRRGLVGSYSPIRASLTRAFAASTAPLPPPPTRADGSLEYSTLTEMQLR